MLGDTVHNGRPLSSGNKNNRETIASYSPGHNQKFIVMKDHIQDVKHMLKHRFNHIQGSQTRLKDKLNELGIKDEELEDSHGDMSDIMDPAQVNQEMEKRGQNYPANTYSTPRQSARKHSQPVAKEGEAPEKNFGQPLYTLSELNTEESPNFPNSAKKMAGVKKEINEPNDDKAKGMEKLQIKDGLVLDQVQPVNPMHNRQDSLKLLPKQGIHIPNYKAARERISSQNSSMSKSQVSKSNLSKPVTPHNAEPSSPYYPDQAQNSLSKHSAMKWSIFQAEQKIKSLERKKLFSSIEGGKNHQRFSYSKDIAENGSVEESAQKTSPIVGSNMSRDSPVREINNLLPKSVLSGVSAQVFLRKKEDFENFRKKLDRIIDPLKQRREYEEKMRKINQIKAREASIEKIAKETPAISSFSSTRPPLSKTSTSLLDQQLSWNKNIIARTPKPDYKRKLQLSTIK